MGDELPTHDEFCNTRSGSPFSWQSEVAKEIYGQPCPEVYDRGLKRVNLGDVRNGEKTLNGPVYVSAWDGGKVQAFGTSVVYAHRGSEVAAGKGSYVWASGDEKPTFERDMQNLGAFLGITKPAVPSEPALVTAYRGSSVSAFDDSRIVANAGAIVSAEDKTQIVARAGSIVHASGEAEVTAQAGSYVFAIGKAVVHVEPGARVYEAVKRPAVPYFSQKMPY